MLDDRKVASRMCCKVTTAITGKVASMAHIATTGIAWYEQVCRAVNCMKESVILAIVDSIANENLLKRLAEKKQVKVNA